MKICGITMVYRDYWALSQWYAHYSRHLGSENLFVVAHGHDPKISELCPRASVITVPRDELAGFDRMRGQMLNSIQDGLAVAYDWVIRTDVDELIFIDPAHHNSFADLFKAYRKPKAIFALGMNVAEVEGDQELGRADSVMSKRCHAVFSGHYSKAWAVKRGIALVRHGIEVAPSDLDHEPFTLPKGVYLAHLKYANIAALDASNAHRTKIANGSEKGLPGKAWSAADEDALRFFRAFAGVQMVDWPEASDKAYQDTIRSPVRDAKLNVLRARSTAFDFSTILPDWFKYR